MRVETSIVPSELDKAYAAGLIDGEGSIYIAKQIQKGRVCPAYWLRVQVTSTTPCLTTWLGERWGGSIFAAPPGQKSTWCNKTNYQWYVAESKAAAMLRDVAPFLVLKSEQAQLALRFCARPRLNAGRHYSVEEKAGMLASQDDIYHQMKALKLTA